LPRLHYERLSEESADYLEIESSRQRAHVAMTLVFDAGPLATEDGGVDFARIREVVEARLIELPRLRSKLRRIPLDGHQVWVDDPEFNLDYHLRQSSLPRPGTDEQLCRTAARVTASRLNRSRPLWECWIFEGLENDRFALIFKIHQALADEEGADLLRAILSTSAERADEQVASFRPRPAPSPLELFGSEVIRGWSPSRKAISSAIGWVRRPARAQRGLRVRAAGLLRAMGYVLRPSGESPFDGHLGPHRSFEIENVSLDAAQRVRASLGGSVHDAVLCIFAGAVRQFMGSRFVSPVTVDLKAVTPVLEGGGREATPWVVELPVWEGDPVERHRIIREQTLRKRDEQDVTSGESLSSISRWTSSRAFSIGAQALKKIERGHLAILQSPGPQQPLFLDGAQLRECYGHLPLQNLSGLGLTVLSYDGELFFAFNADAEIVPDLAGLRASIQPATEELVEAAESRRPGLRAVSS